jgi:hypothetical protein
VAGLFQYSHHPQVREKAVRAYKDKPARTEHQVRYQLTVSRHQAAIAQTEFNAGWRNYASNAPTERLSRTDAVLVHRGANCSGVRQRELCPCRST